MSCTALFTDRSQTPPEILRAWELLAAELPLSTEKTPGCREVIFRKGGNLQIASADQSTVITYRTLTEAIRGTGLALAGVSSADEKCPFNRFGVMLDQSRNAVMNMDFARKTLRNLALAGYNRVFLYTEDTYELPGEPHFGVLRGRYTANEIKELDSYADTLGIELAGCIQTLGHLATFLRLSGSVPVKDTASVLLAEEEKTYDLIRKMLTFWAENCRSRTIHIGMDETHDLGRGKYLDRFGWQRNFDIFNCHLIRVCQICRELGLEPLIWSDMYFRMGSASGSYYDPAAVIPADILSDIPEETTLVYWDYYHLNEDFYRQMIDAHRNFGRKVAVASGLWTWARLSYDHNFTVERAEPCIRAGAGCQMDEFFFTMWGDDGAYCNFDTAFAGLLWGADVAYGNDGKDQEKLEKMARSCFNTSFSQAVRASEMNFSAPHRDNGVGTCSILLWDDPIMGVGWRQLNLDDEKTYSDFTAALTASLEQDFYPMPLAVSRTLLAKLQLRKNLLTACRENNQALLKEITEKYIPETADCLRQLLEEFRTQWLKNYRFAGLENIQIRLAGNLIRLEELDRRITDTLNGNQNLFPELSVESDPRCQPIMEWYRDFAFSGVN